jgi:hypothetical protein
VYDSVILHHNARLSRSAARVGLNRSCNVVSFLKQRLELVYLHALTEGAFVPHDEKVTDLTKNSFAKPYNTDVGGAGGAASPSRIGFRPQQSEHLWSSSAMRDGGHSQKGRETYAPRYEKVRVVGPSNTTVAWKGQSSMICEWEGQTYGNPLILHQDP